MALSAPTGMIKQNISMSITDTEIIRLPAEPGVADRHRGHQHETGTAGGGEKPPLF